mmetsp:Transcript_18795/g.16639  ORF Transcript_18795/g.16639 Transcript_18795/m.16639 type:complete len:101 (+) Transcript_18795:1354-1656(+)
MKLSFNIESGSISFLQFMLDVLEFIKVEELEITAWKKSLETTDPDTRKKISELIFDMKRLKYFSLFYKKEKERMSARCLLNKDRLQQCLNKFITLAKHIN